MLVLASQESLRDSFARQVKLTEGHGNSFSPLRLFMVDFEPCLGVKAILFPVSVCTGSLVFTSKIFQNLIESIFPFKG